MADAAGLADKYLIRQRNYAATAEYGGPKVNEENKVPIQSVQDSPDRMKVFLRIDGLKKDRVIHIKATGLKSAQGDPSRIREARHPLNNLSGML